VGRFGCLLILVMLGLFIAGGQGCYEAVRNRAPHEMTCADADKGLPEAQWLHLKDCTLNVLGAAYQTRNGKPTNEIYIPISGGGENKLSRIVLKTNDPDVVAVVKEMAALDEKNTSGFLAFMARNKDRMFRTKDVKGMVQAGIDKSDKVQSKLREMNKELAADFVVLDEGREPGFIKSGLMLGGGALVGVLLLAIGRGGSS
jgi:hypothetical protein